VYDPINPTLPSTSGVSNLHFHNTYDTTTIPQQFLMKVQEAAWIAELNLEDAFRLQGRQPVKLNVSFDFTNLGDPNLTKTLASNNGNNWQSVSFAQLKSDLLAAANFNNPSTAAGVAALSLPLANPDPGALFQISPGQAQIFNPTMNNMSHTSTDVTVNLNSLVKWETFSVDAMAAVIEHEITEGGMGRLGSLGYSGPPTAMDLFRYSAPGVHDYSANGPSYFSLDGQQMLNQFQDVTIGPDGKPTGDLDDFAGYDVFGLNDQNSSPALSDTDYKVMSALGWNDWYPSVVPNRQYDPSYKTWSVKDLIIAEGGTVPGGPFGNFVDPNPHPPNFHRWNMFDNFVDPNPHPPNFHGSLTGSTVPLGIPTGIIVDHNPHPTSGTLSGSTVPLGTPTGIIVDHNPGGPHIIPTLDAHATTTFALAQPHIPMLPIAHG
jgi:hypothetical protein